MARHQDKLEEIANEARQLSGNEVFVFPTDISKADQIDRAFNEIISHVNHIDYLVNAAGFGVFKEFLETSPQVVTEMFQTNVLGLMYFTKLLTLAQLLELYLLLKLQHIVQLRQLLFNFQMFYV